MNDIKVDFGQTASDYSTHRAGFPLSFFNRLSAHLNKSSELHALDVGTGTGTVARGLAKLGVKVSAIDPSAELLAKARELALKESLSISFLQAQVEQLPFGDRSLDLVTAGQCWHWFAANRALSEIERVLRPGGQFVICYFDWVQERDNPVEAMVKLRQKYNPAWKENWPGYYPTGPYDLELPPQFSVQAAFSYNELINYTQEAWRGRIRASAGIGGSLPAEDVAKFDREYEEVLAARYPNPMHVPHHIWAQIWQRN